MMASTDQAQTLSIWTIYDHPLDYPHGFIARRWSITGKGAEATNDVVTADTLVEVRRLLPAPHGLFRLPRQDGDDPKIVESWI